MTLQEKFENIEFSFPADESVKIADEFAIGFLNFIHKYFYKCENSTYYPNTKDKFESKYYSIEELLEIYKKEKGL